MKAEDTVMTGKEIDRVVNTFSQMAGYNDARTIEQVVAETQAEISFKAGIKEIVDFIASQARRSGADKYYNADGTMQLRAIFCPIIFTDEWQSKLKEWGC